MHIYIQYFRTNNTEHSTGSVYLIEGMQVASVLVAETEIDWDIKWG